MSDYNEDFGDGEIVPTEYARSSSGDSFEDIFRQHYRVATNYVISGESRSHLMTAERAVRTLEMELSINMMPEEMNSIAELKRKQSRVQPFDPPSKDRYRDILMKRLNVVLKVMGRKGMLPAKEGELEG